MTPIPELRPRHPRAAQPGDVVHDPATGTTLEFVETSASTGARRLVIEWTLPPDRGTGSLAHRHPTVAERWDVLEGRARYRLGRARPVADAPHSWVVPVNTSHVHPSNAGDRELRVRQTIETPEPDQLLVGVERYFETLFALAQQGRTDAKGDIRDPLQAALTIREFLMPGSYLSGPPRWLQDALFGAAAALARLRGRTAYHAPERQ